MTDADHHAVITEEGKQKAEEELHELKTVRRKQVAEKIEAAKEMGDINENAEYAEAKEEQAFLEARILELENMLAYAEIVTPASEGDSVVMIGSNVEVHSEQGKRLYTIVGYNEANPGAGKISNESPLGQALVGKRVGDQVTVATPSGNKTYIIEAIT